MDASNLLLFAVPSTWLKPLPWVALAAVCALALLYLLGLLSRQIMPKVAAIAWTTSKESMSQPLFYILMAFGVVGLIIFPFIPYNTLGEDLKMLKDEGLSLIMVLSIFLAVWTASLSIAEEIEGRTALTLLSKPVGRRQFIFGKFLGILIPVAIMFIILGAIFMSSISYKIVYDVRETGRPAATVAECLGEIIMISPGLLLAFMEAIVLTAISVAISTRLPMMANMIICASIYVLGNLVPMLAGSAMGQYEIIKFFANLLAAVLPVLDYFNISAAISRGHPVPLFYLGMTALYCFLYCCVAMLVALLLFEDRDLA